MKKGLKPIVDDQSRILILGSLPGDVSLAAGQYYASPRNQFWRILSRIYHEPIGRDYESKRAFLHQHDIALWDVLKAAERLGSLDSNIRSSIANDLEGLICRHPQIRMIGLNGRKAEKDFNRYGGASAIFHAGHLHVRYLPSSSSALTKPFEEKVQAWQEFLKPVI